ncbi:hypothetical protein PSHT_03609, partial [Puccinia striiformis]
ITTLWIILLFEGFLRRSNSMTITQKVIPNISEAREDKAALCDVDTVDRAAPLALDSSSGASEPLDHRQTQNYDFPYHTLRGSSTIAPSKQHNSMPGNRDTSQVWPSALIHPGDLFASTLSLDKEFEQGLWSNLHWPEVPEPDTVKSSYKQVSADMTLGSTPSPLTQRDVAGEIELQRPSLPQAVCKDTHQTPPRLWTRPLTDLCLSHMMKTDDRAQLVTSPKIQSGEAKYEKSVKTSPSDPGELSAELTGSNDANASTIIQPDSLQKKKPDREHGHPKAFSHRQNPTDREKQSQSRIKSGKSGDKDVESGPIHSKLVSLEKCKELNLSINNHNLELKPKSSNQEEKETDSIQPGSPEETLRNFLKNKNKKIEFDQSIQESVKNLSEKELEGTEANMNQAGSSSASSSKNESRPNLISKDVQHLKGKQAVPEDYSIDTTNTSDSSSRQKSQSGSNFRSGKKVGLEKSKGKSTMSPQQLEKLMAKNKWKVSGKNNNLEIDETSSEANLDKLVPNNLSQKEIPSCMKEKKLSITNTESSMGKIGAGDVDMAQVKKYDQKGEIENIEKEFTSLSINKAEERPNQSHQKDMPPISLLDSPKKILKSEEDHIIGLMKERKYPEHFKLVCSVPKMFNLAYDLQADHLNSAFQKSKEAYRSKNNNSQSVIMHSSKIDRQIHVKIDQIYKDLIFLPAKPELERTKLYNYSESTVQSFFKLWGQENVLSWEENRLDIGLMAQLSLVLNLEHKRSHVGISPLFHKIDLYERLHYLEKKELHKVIDSIYKILGKEESTRRFEAFCGLLRHHTYARNWSWIRHHWLQKGLDDRLNVYYYERKFGVSEYPKSQEILVLMVHLDLFIIKVFGNQYGEKKLELIRYIEKCPYQSTWWRSVGLESAIRKFGLDPLVILKIGNSLQFGHKKFDANLVIEGEPISIVESFYTIYKIMTEARTLPWIESAERAWLYSSCGEFYQDRLLQLSHLCFSKTVGIGLNAFALIWCDLGLKSSEMPTTPLETHFQIPSQKKRYEKMSGPFSDYAKLAIPIWYRSIHANHPNPISKQIIALVKGRSRRLPLSEDPNHLGKGIDSHRTDMDSWKFFKDFVIYSLKLN